MSRLPKRFTPLELKHRRQARRERKRKHMVALGLLRHVRSNKQWLRETFPPHSRKRNKSGAAVMHPDYVPKHYIGENFAGHRISLTQTKADWAQHHA